jgi:hypothetical protein
MLAMIIVTEPKIIDFGIESSLFKEMRMLFVIHAYYRTLIDNLVSSL